MGGRGYHKRYRRKGGVNDIIGLGKGGVERPREEVDDSVGWGMRRGGG